MFGFIDNVDAVRVELSRINNRLISISERYAAKMAAREEQIDALVVKNHDDRARAVVVDDLQAKLGDIV